MRRFLSLMLLLMTVSACERRRPVEGVFADGMAELDAEPAELIYSRMRFDTIQWASNAERADSGARVYTSNCAKCHGPDGAGNAEYARATKLRAPSLIDSGWHFGDDETQVRRRIVTGHPPRRPDWGVAGLTQREIDAVTTYVMSRLRKDSAD
jgi:mono/diheme cytochrome c family protein